MGSGQWAVGSDWRHWRNRGQARRRPMHPMPPMRRAADEDRVVVSGRCAGFDGTTDTSSGDAARRGYVVRQDEGRLDLPRADAQGMAADEGDGVGIEAGKAFHAKMEGVGGPGLGPGKAAGSILEDGDGVEVDVA